MKKPAAPLPIIKDRKLYSSTPAQQAEEKNKAQKLTQYRRDYWQGYKARVRRVYGTIKPAEYNAIKELSDANNISVWEQLVSDARAYRAGVILAPKDILLAQDNLVGELRRIGNNINQLTRLGHIQAKKNGRLEHPVDDKVGIEALRQLESLEQSICVFESVIPDYITQAPVTEPST